MTSSALYPYKGNPSLYINGQLVPAVSAFVTPEHVDRFKQAGMKLYTIWFYIDWWIGPDEYDFSEFDRRLGDYCAAIPDGYLMPRIDLAPRGFPWWGEQNPDEMVVMRSIATGEVMDPSESDPRGEEHLHHGVHLKNLNLHSFHSLKWREDVGRAIAAMVKHVDQQPYGDQIWAWMLCDGWPQEWFHWGEYLLDGLEDYSPAAQSDFKRWLRKTYQNDESSLQAAWGREVTFDSALIPEPGERTRPTHGEFYDPVLDRPTIDYTECISDSIVDSILAVCQAAKDAMREPKVVCTFYGYPFCHLPRPQLLGHNAMARLLESHAVDLIASPHSYDNRGYGGYHSPQSIADTIRRAGKMHFDEVDCKTIWTPKVRWKDNISEPPDLWSTIEMIKKDTAYQIVSAGGMWWCDLLNQGWYDADECIEPIRRMRQIEEKILAVGRQNFGEVALVVSERSQLFQAQKDGLVDATREMFRNWFLSRMGAPFEQLLLSDLEKADLPDYKLYIMADAFYLSQAEREMILRKVKGSGATVLWIYAPGFLDDHSAGLENMQAITGIHFGKRDLSDELNVRLTRMDHPITAGLAEGLRYGTGVDREQYLRAPMIQYLPDTRVSPQFYAADPDATVLGVAESSGQPGLVVKERDGWRSIYSAGPVLSWQVMRNIARWAGVHLYDEQGDMIWGNDRLLVIYSQEAGRRTIRFPEAVDIEDAYAETPLASQVRQIDLEMKQFETRLLLVKR
jgi:hypothetical protein